jgi:polyhydroxyalkanoate synthesis regulator phasin
MNLTRSSIALYIGLVFISGVILGGFGDHVYGTYRVSPAKSGKAPKSPEDVRRGIIDFWRSHLKLTDDQVVKVGLIMDETRARMDEVHRGTLPAQQEIRREQMDKMRAMLSPEQKMEYDRLQKEREDRIKKGGPRGGPGGF